MNPKFLLLGAVGLCVALVAGCNDAQQGATAPPPVPQSLDTAQVLVLAQQSSEADTPIAVDAGALTLAGTSETSTPIAVSAL
jgi:type IV pilus biogenesis protein CpaD/CtpE